MLLLINRLLPSTPVFGTRGLSWLLQRCCRALLLCLSVAWPFVGISNASAQALTPGTIVGWGSNEYGQTNIPAGLSGVTAIASGAYHSLALKSDGTVVGWGSNGEGQTSVPAGLSGVTAIAGGGSHSVAANTKSVDTTPPTVTMVVPTQNARYLIQQRVNVSYSCADPSTVALCSGSQPVGALLDTARLGPKTFFVTATDGRGNTGSTLINYTVEARPSTLPPATPPRRK